MTKCCSSHFVQLCHICRMVLKCVDFTAASNNSVCLRMWYSQQHNLYRNCLSSTYIVLRISQQWKTKITIGMCAGWMDSLLSRIRVHCEQGRAAPSRGVLICSYSHHCQPQGSYGNENHSHLGRLTQASTCVSSPLWCGETHWTLVLL